MLHEIYVLFSFKLLNLLKDWPLIVVKKLVLQSEANFFARSSLTSYFQLISKPSYYAFDIEINFEDFFFFALLSSRVRS